VPTGFWPSGTRIIADLLPVTHGLSAVRGILVSAPLFQVLTSIGLELLVGLGWFVANGRR
jgi:ABC-2 type transport system permease protein